MAFKQKSDIVRTLERMAVRKDVLNQSHLAEAISLVVWNPETGKVNPDLPDSKSILRIEKFSDLLYPHYLNRYKGLPPHDETSSEEEEV